MAARASANNIYLLLPQLCVMAKPGMDRSDDDLKEDYFKREEDIYLFHRAGIIHHWSQLSLLDWISIYLFEGIEHCNHHNNNTHTHYWRESDKSEMRENIISVLGYILNDDTRCVRRVCLALLK